MKSTMSHMTWRTWSHCQRSLTLNTSSASMSVKWTISVPKDTQRSSNLCTSTIIVTRIEIMSTVTMAITAIRTTMTTNSIMIKIMSQSTQVTRASGIISSTRPPSKTSATTSTIRTCPRRNVMLKISRKMPTKSLLSSGRGTRT